MAPDLPARRAAVRRSMRRAVSLAIGVAGAAWWDGWMPGFGLGHYDWLVEAADLAAYLMIEGFFLLLAGYGSRLAALLMLLGGGGPVFIVGAAVDGWLAWGNPVPTRCSVVDHTWGVDRATGLMNDTPLFAVDLHGAVPRQMGWCETSGRSTLLAVALRGRPPNALELPTAEEVGQLRASAVPMVDSGLWHTLFPAVTFREEILRRIGTPPAPIPYAWAPAGGSGCPLLARSRLDRGAAGLRTGDDGRR